MVYTWIFCLGRMITGLIKIRKKSGGLRDSPLERGVGVCYVSGLIYPRNRTSKCAPSQEGSYNLLLSARP